MPRDSNANLAVSMFRKLIDEHSWSEEEAWKAIAILLLSCKIFRSRWEDFHNVVVYRESNDFKLGSRGPNAVLLRAERLTQYLADQLNVRREDICDYIGQFWRHPNIMNLQPNNLLGNAFRSLITDALAKFGNSEITYEEEVRPHAEFPGHSFDTRSQNSKIDIVAKRNGIPVALLSTRWRFRHDRVDLVDEAMAYSSAARRVNRNCKLYAVVGEFNPARLDKVLKHCPPAHPNPAISATVHFNPLLVTDALEENGRTRHLKSLSWLINETHDW